MKKKKIVAIIMLVFFTLAGCSSYKITNGEVYDKKFNEAYITTTYIPLCITTGKSVSCTPTPYNIIHQESYEINIKRYDEKENTWRTATYYVDEESYNKIKIGNQFEYDKNSMLEESPVIKEKVSDEE